MANVESVEPTFDQTFFTLYPNPTNGNFTLVQKGDRQYGSVKVEIFGMRGDKVLSSQMIGEKKHEFVASALPAGLYFVKVVADDYTETIKLIKIL
ncbi:MAG: T9SS type A sorting domain-containing protein [Bacteroidetes bacterium]|nr:T9SS type A sorting domain-containing protein [Bacteroidota bacterium]